MSEATSPISDAPVLRITRGNATPEEIAAITVVLTAAAAQTSAAGAASSTRRTGWSHRSRALNPGAVRGAGWGRLG